MLHVLNKFVNLVNIFSLAEKLPLVGDIAENIPGLDDKAKKSENRQGGATDRGSLMAKCSEKFEDPKDFEDCRAKVAMGMSEQEIFG